MEAFIYLGKVSLYWVLLYACYWLLLRQHTFFRWNRAYLLGSLLLAFVLPLLKYPASAPPLPVVYEVTAAPVVISAQVPSSVSFPWLKLLALLYLSGAVAMAYRLYNYLRELFSFIRQGEVIELEECTLVLMDTGEVGSFSFWKWVVVSRTDYEQHFDAILRHELVHVQQRHSFDILLVEVLRVLFWFNPVLIFYKNSLQQVHEYLADEEAPERDRYAEFLVYYALGTPVAALTNHFFNASLLKERIKMLYRQRNSRWSLGKYGAVALLVGLVAIVAAGCEREVHTHASSGVLSEKEMIVEKENPALQKPLLNIVDIKSDDEGMRPLYDYVHQNLKYPQTAIDAQVEGEVRVRFTIDHQEGNIRDVQIMKGLGFGLDEEAIRVVSSLPRHKSVTPSGQPVDLMVYLPITFELAKHKK